MKLLTQKIPLLSVLVALLFVAASCGKSEGSRKPSNVDYYTCTMHPSVKSQTPGKCPICSMDLVPVMRRGGKEAKSQGSPQIQDVKSGGEMKDMPGMKTAGGTKGAQTSECIVPVERQQQISVAYAKVERGPLRHTIRAGRMVVPDSGRHWQFVARVDGYVQKLNDTAQGETGEK